MFKLTKLSRLLGVIPIAGFSIAYGQSSPEINSTAPTPAPSNAVVPALPTAAATADPYENYNRAAFRMNTRLDRHVMKPVATFYNKVMPKPLNDGINNFFNNISTVSTVVNDVLQASFGHAGKDTTRLAINTTVGLIGFFDVASRLGIDKHDETFGLTMAKWGWKNTNYFVIPFLGPSTVRDGLGKPVDWLIEYPIYGIIQNDEQRWGVVALSFVNQRAQLLRYQNLMQQASLDPYIFQRNAYMQHQDYLIQLNSGATNSPEPSINQKTSHDDFYVGE
jgi:phospholipid-binding lipoprotein MlaA